ncbi:MAG: NADP oxidoreductase, partial [Candidatus Hydrogenedentes bacterium]|nr:NADP oxidoreductase [Candidatus Hydrogenedentota bacterium]
GPSGVIGTNKPDSLETVERLLEDVDGLMQCPVRENRAIVQFLKKKRLRYVSLADWHKIDEAELARGAAVGKPRERFTRIEEMLRVIER